MRFEPVDKGIVLAGSTVSTFIQRTGKSLTYWTEHSNSMEPPISITFSWEMYEIVGNLCASTAKSKSIDNTYSNLLSNQLGKLNYLTT